MKKLAFKSIRAWLTILSPFFKLDVTTKSAECVPQAVHFNDEVVVGPTPAPELTAEALQALFAAEGHPEVIVRDSNIAFKSWWRR